MSGYSGWVSRSGQPPRILEGGADMREETSRAWREVDLNALAHNARVLQGALAPGCRLMSVVKADAYGHGSIPVAGGWKQRE